MGREASSIIPSLDRWLAGWLAGRDGRMDGRTDGRMDGTVYTASLQFHKNVEGAVVCMCDLDAFSLQFPFPLIVFFNRLHTRT